MAPQRLPAEVQSQLEAISLDSIAPKLGALGVRSIQDLALVDDADLERWGLSTIERRRFFAHVRSVLGEAALPPGALTGATSSSRAKDPEDEASFLRPAPKSMYSPGRPSKKQPAMTPTQSMPLRTPGPTATAPAYYGAASRKRKYELCLERGIVPAPMGYGSQPHPPVPKASRVAGGARPPPGPPPASVVRNAARRAQVPAQPAPPPAPPPVILHGVSWIELEATAPLIAEQDLPSLAPALCHSSELQGLMSSAQHILSEIWPDDATQVTMQHDPNWEEFPEVGEALKAAGLEEQCFVLATCTSLSKWAIGLGGKWKNREQAARLALCVALAANLEDFSGLVASYPEFTEFCEKSGIVTDNAGAAEPPLVKAKPRQGRAKGKDPADAAWTEEAPPAVSSKKAKSAKAKSDGAAPAAAAATAVGGVQLPRDMPLWIACDDGSEVTNDAVLDGLQTSALALCTDNSQKGLYSNADAALAHILSVGPEEVAEDGTDTLITYHDDANWEKFPLVGAALKTLAEKEECLCVAVCVSRGLWAAGVGMKGRNRYSAAKIALAAQLAMQAMEISENVDLAEFSALEGFVAEAQAARA